MLIELEQGYYRYLKIVEQCPTYRDYLLDKFVLHEMRKFLPATVYMRPKPIGSMEWNWHTGTAIYKTC